MISNRSIENVINDILYDVYFDCADNEQSVPKQSLNVSNRRGGWAAIVAQSNAATGSAEPVLVPSPERFGVKKQALRCYNEIRFDFDVMATLINQ